MLRRALLLALVCVGGLAASAARAEEPALRKWHLGVQATAGARSTHDVFATPLLPGAAVEKKGRGAGFFLGRRFGDRFLVDLQVTWARHDMASAADDVIDVEALITGTVLFRERDTFQPFVRGGFGGGGTMIGFTDSGDNVFSFGTAAIAGGGCQVRLGSRVSLEFEAVATFTNYLEVRNESGDPRFDDDSWQVRVSSHGWRTGAGVVFWF